MRVQTKHEKSLPEKNVNGRKNRLCPLNMKHFLCYVATLYIYVIFRLLFCNGFLLLNFNLAETLIPAQNLNLCNKC